MWRQKNFSNKYYASSTIYNGTKYDSKLEARYAQDLDLLLKAKEIKSWERQIRISLDVNGYHICNYIVDFRVITKTGQEQLIETKGFETDVWRMKRKLLEATYLVEHPEVEYIVVK